MRKTRRGTLPVFVGTSYAGASADSEANAGAFRSGGAEAAPAAARSSARRLSLAALRNASGVVPVYLRKSVVR
jgi:hypothetical protein